MSIIQLHDKQFKPYISENEIINIVKKVAADLEKDFDTFNNPLFLIILNGSFMFAADLFKYLNKPCEMSFVKTSSYHYTKSSGKIQELIGLNENIANRTVIILEDIIDTGLTLEYIIKQLKDAGNTDHKIVTAFFKPESFTKDYPIHYIGKKIPNDFIVGYGLDYNGLGRNLKEVYILHHS